MSSKSKGKNSPKQAQSGNKKDPSSGANANRNKSLNDTKVRAAGRNSGSYPGQDVLDDAASLHDEDGDVIDTTGGMPGSPRAARGTMRNKSKTAGADTKSQGGDQPGGELEGGGGGGGLPSPDIMNTPASTRRARKRS